MIVFPGSEAPGTFWKEQLTSLSLLLGSSRSAGHWVLGAVNPLGWSQTDLDPKPKSATYHLSFIFLV